METNRRRKRYIGEDGSTRLEKSIEEEGSRRLENFTEEQDEETGGSDASSTNADALNDKSKSNENAEGENRGFKDEQQHDTPFLEQETSHTVESSPSNPSPDTSLIKPIRYSDYSFETMIKSRGRVSYDLTIEYLLKVVNSNVKISHLYGFSWGFMIVHPWISPTPSEMEMDFLTRFVPLQLTKDDKIEKLERDLNGAGEIKRDCTVDEGNLDPSRVVYVGGTVVGDGGENSSPNVDRGISGIVSRGGGGSSPFATSVLGGFSGGFGGGRSPINENVSRPQETPSPIEVPSCKVCHEKIDFLTSKVDSLEKAITTMMSKRGIWPSSRILDPYTPEVAKRRKK
ncbi:hypothetical protein FXO37_09090 [Capsicum annuum]|nr:hypothetical protein FXO37_09090 [Capsicum annuum]